MILDITAFFSRCVKFPPLYILPVLWYNDTDRETNVIGDTSQITGDNLCNATKFGMRQKKVSGFALQKRILIRSPARGEKGGMYNAVDV